MKIILLIRVINTYIRILFAGDEEKMKFNLLITFGKIKSGWTCNYFNGAV